MGKGKDIGLVLIKEKIIFLQDFSCIFYAYASTMLQRGSIFC